jgi:hypothetical protein
MRTIAAVIIFVLAAMSARQAAAQQPCPTLVVSNNSDVVNGDTSSPCNLIADPGSDGISLREAMEAANNATSGGAITITFASALAGQTIAPSSANGCCYYITRDDVTIAGLVGSRGQPTVTIDASNMFILFRVTGSNVKVGSLRIIGLETATPGDKFGFQVGPGPSGPSVVSNIVIQGNVFIDQPGYFGLAVVMSFSPQGTNEALSNVTVANNTFTNNGGGVNLWGWGNSNIFQDVSISDNTFTDISDPVELASNYGSGNQILHTRIIGNTFNGDSLGIDLDHSGVSNNVFDGTVIEGNIFIDTGSSAIALWGGQAAGESNNAITNTSIVNNLITGDTQYGAISIIGGGQGATQNYINGVSIVNNTIANNPATCCYAAVGFAANVGGSTGNTVSGVSVSNTIFWNNGYGDMDGLTPAQVQSSITTQAGFAGVNGNIASNPLFVNSSDNFELQSGSPARHAGTNSGAPAIDIDCQPRGVPPSIGAYEFEGPDICPATYSPPLPLTATPASGHGPLAVAFRTSGLTRGKAYKVNFGDGSIGPVTQGSCFVSPPVGGGEGGVLCSGFASHTYTTAGTYTATLVSVSGGPLGSSVTVTVGGLRPLAAGAAWWRKVPAR